MKIDLKLDKEIEDLKNKLQNWEDIDPVYMDEQTKEIRHKVMHIHERAEISIEIILSSHLLSAVDNKSITQEARLEFNQRFQKIIANTDFSKKLAAAQELKLINKSLVGKLFDVNSLRVRFSHPSAYQNEIRRYRDNQLMQLETLKKLEILYDSLNEYFSKTTGLSKEELEKLEKESFEESKNIK